VSLENLRQWAAFFNDASNGSWLLAFALVALTMTVSGATWLALKLHQLPTRPRPRQSVGCQRIDLDEDQDQVDDFIRDAIRHEADRAERDR